MNSGLLTTYRDHLPLTEDTPLFSLGEGDTPLVRSRSIVSKVGCVELYFKLEGCNPTGSFKDRGMVVAVAKAVEAGSTDILCASTGNTSASAAAYGAYCGLATTVLVPKGGVARGKLAQAMAYGARIVIIDGSFDETLALVREISKRRSAVLVNSLNPHRIQGQKTAAFEIVRELGDAPDYLCIPVGNAGNITAYWLGFREAESLKWAGAKPKILGFQADGAAPIVRGEPIEHPESVASALRVGNPARWRSAVSARDESGGVIESVSDDEILSAYRLMAEAEGIFCEPASAACVAGLLRLSRESLDLSDKRVVCVITGTGLKDPDAAAMLEPMSVDEHPAELSALESALSVP